MVNLTGQLPSFFPEGGNRFLSWWFIRLKQIDINLGLSSGFMDYESYFNLTFFFRDHGYRIVQIVRKNVIVYKIYEYD